MIDTFFSAEYMLSAWLWGSVSVTLAAICFRFGEQRFQWRGGMIIYPLLAFRLLVPLPAPWGLLPQSILWTWLMGFLLLGAVMYFLMLTLRTLVCYRSATLNEQKVPEQLSAEFVQACRRMRLGSCPRLLVTRGEQGALIMGIIRPLVIIPEALASAEPERLRHVTYHELQHYKNGDLIMNWLWTLALSFHWFNPMIARIAKRNSFLNELECDARTCASLPDPDARHAYAQTLALLAESPWTADGAAAVVESADSIVERIERLAKPPLSRGRKELIPALVLTICASIPFSLPGLSATPAVAHSLAETVDHAVVISSSEKKLGPLDPQFPEASAGWTAYGDRAPVRSYKGPSADKVLESKQWVLTPEKGTGMITITRHLFDNRSTIQRSWGRIPEEEDSAFMLYRSGRSLYILHSADRALMYDFYAARFKDDIYSLFANLERQGIAVGKMTSGNDPNIPGPFEYIREFSLPKGKIRIYKGKSEEYITEKLRAMASGATIEDCYQYGEIILQLVTDGMSANEINDVRKRLKNAVKTDSPVRGTDVATTISATDPDAEFQNLPEGWKAIPQAEVTLYRGVSADVVKKAHQWELKYEGRSESLVYTTYTFESRDKARAIGWKISESRGNPNYFGYRKFTDFNIAYSKDRYLILKLQYDLFNHSVFGILAELEKSGISLSSYEAVQANEHEKVAKRLGVRLGVLVNAFLGSDRNQGQLNIVEVQSDSMMASMLKTMIKIGQKRDNLFQISDRVILEFVPRNMPSETVVEIRRKLVDFTKNYKKNVPASQ